MRVLYIITGLGDGGAEAVLHRLVTHDSADEHHVVSLMGEGKYGPILRDQGVQVTALAMPRGRITLAGMRRLWRAVRRTRPDVVQTWMYHADLLGGVVGRLCGVPVVWGIRNTTLEHGQSVRTTITVRRLCGALSRVLPKRIVACAEAAVQVHAATGYDVGRMAVVPNGYDLTRFSPDAALRAQLRQVWGFPKEVPVLGMVARYDPYKDHENLLAALRLLRDRGMVFQAVLVGTGVDNTNTQLTLRISTLGMAGQVRLLGPKTDVVAVMNALDVHVLSSSAEAFPNVLAEAMACGTPCVSTDVGDAAQIVGGTGWIVPSRSPQALAEALGAALQAWTQRSNWVQRQAACRARIEERYSLGSMVQAYREVWQSVSRESAADG